jgi:hypothetical protein
LEITASQPGAQVYEAEALLGATPLRITLDSASVSRAPRTFTVRKAGYAPYTIVQGTSSGDARAFAELAASPTAAIAPAPHSKPRKPPEIKASPAKPPASPPSDIFMQR